LPCGASIILGNNGYIWISPTTSHDENSSDSAGGGGGFVQNFEVYWCLAWFTIQKYSQIL